MNMDGEDVKKNQEMFRSRKEMRVTWEQQCTTEWDMDEECRWNSLATEVIFFFLTTLYFIIAFHWLKIYTLSQRIKTVPLSKGCDQD